MASLDRIVNVQIALNTTGISTLGFSTLLCVGPHMYGLTRVSTYTDANQMIDDGFSSDDALYRMVSAAFAQTPSPAQVKVGRQQVDGFTLTVGQVGATSTYTLTVSNVLTDGTIREKAYTYTNSSGTTSDILKGILQEITNDEEAVITDNEEQSSEPMLTELHLEAKNTGTAFSVKVTSNLQTSMDATTEDIANTMAAVSASDSDFYGIALASRTDDDILDMAEWAEANEKLFGTATDADGAKNSEIATDIGSKLQDKNYYRTFWFYHALAAEEYPECAIMARCFSINPGGETWANKQLSSITTDSLSETEALAVQGKNGNTFEPFRNISITQNGKVAAGEWIDVIRFRDWLAEEIKVNVFNLLINRDKVPYTDAGIAAIESQIRAALTLGQTRGGIAPTEYDENGNQNLGFTISVPLSSSISPNQKALRILNDVKFTARLAGAIHVVNITGNLTYENLIVAA
ncbi:DUF3383 domain-containing protein [Megasphaera butyrica]|uniref:DUF3383 family protein n=1 Tax=Megasphaera butyrica TaxID=2981791 RepID=UPI000821A905|nr:DUF3383 family protein [Megasphaera butyrica]MCU6714967.1 DUF3383 domain-containing protein [Megasphaera butyrica]SCH85638.1 Protein of uncharacterised function (DUF3383) [uncultured Megasphaera sp.]SCJ43523.1 Protein of uncharacterised function (DUF3383) [uncultured Ruminococcus sp.]